jgi:DNA-binding LacI/PurR family transcriptional regulator
MSRPSTQDIADSVGVSKMTVSRALRGKGGRHEAQILEVARNLNYIPVRPAIQNRNVKTNIIGVLEEGNFLFNTGIGSQTLSSVAQTTFSKGYDLLLLRPQHSEPLEKRRIQFLDKRCDGFIFVVAKEDAEIFELLVKNGVPAVACYTTEVPDGIGWVVPDNGQGVRDAVKLLADKGHRNIAFWSGPQGHSDARERTAAFTGAMREFGLPLFQHSYIFEDDNDKIGCPEGLPEIEISNDKEMFSQHITAVICHNDERALLLWDDVLELGLTVPGDVSIVGIDNSPEAQQRGLTTFENPFSEIGNAAANALFSLLEGGSAEENRQRIPMALFERESVAAPRK